MGVKTTKREDKRERGAKTRQGVETTQTPPVRTEAQRRRDAIALIETLPETPDAENQALIDLLRQWREEDAAMTDEEAEEAEAEWETFKTNINETRAREGRPPVYP